MKSRTVWLAALCAGSLAAGSLPVGAVHKGLANGDAAIIATDERVLGYSASTGHWVSRAIDGRIIEQQAGEYLAVVLTTEELLAYNSVADLWAEAAYEGVNPRIHVDGAVAVCLTSEACYGISTVWGAWRSEPFQVLGSAGGCQSAGNFGLVWGGQRACAYSASTHQWIPLVLDEQVIHGFAREGLGVVWTGRAIYGYRPMPAEWIALTPSSPQAICVTGEGEVGLAWGTRSAYGFSPGLGSWFTLSVNEGVRGGSAGGRVALVWSDSNVYSFNADTGVWSSRPLEREEPPRLGAEPRESTAAFAISPNPCASGEVSFRLPGDESWRIEIFDLSGRRLATQTLASGGEGPGWVWDRRDDSGRPAAAGVYWVKAESRERTEARRLVLLP